MANYLDFNDLRNEGITHLGNLTGKLWTDYNVHDPGITILEVLCYAMVDLDYRTQLPAADIFARAPQATGPATQSTTPDNNFYSPAQILSNNPLTILDYRKLLSDIEGIRNAWLEVVTDQQDPCLPQGRTPALLNGLYHIYLETEDDANDDEMLKAAFEKLNAHRNLCEDIADITVLGKVQLGVCAIVELDTDADPTQVYLDMMQALGNFLSPVPHFYTLQELLDKNKPIDAIFAGRPYDTTTSHGFVDTDQLQQIQLKKEVHLSDLYKALFEVSGISTLRDLQWKPCGGTPSASWKFNIPAYHVIDFSPECCGIQFLRNGKPVPFDASLFTTMLQTAARRNIYDTPLPNLDLAYPQGTFRDDLADYYSIQNDFPNVYGIAKGGIPEDAPVARRAAARQLKGFLLFFDQLLADYLSQLANIRNLFSMGPSGDGPTYPLNPLLNGDDPDGPNYVPDVDLLWKSAVDQDLQTLLGTEGTTLVYPAKSDAPGAPLEYDDWNDMQNDIVRLKAAFESGTAKLTISDTTPYSYTISIDDIALLSQKTFEQKQDAQNHATYVLNNGMLDTLYSLISITGDKFTFTLDYHPTSLSNLLHGELEDSALNLKRRQYFLDHLLSRFAERFTDYALLQFGPADPQKKAQNQIKAEESYLSQYATLSSQRGQAADYTMTAWNTANISGLEKKWMAQIGAANGKRHSLCNFIIHKSEPNYRFTITIGGKAFFSPSEIYNSEDSARQAANQLLAALKDRSNYEVTTPGESTPGSHEAIITLHYTEGQVAILIDKYPTEETANAVADRLSSLFAQKPSQWDIFPSTYMFKPKLVDYTGKSSIASTQFFTSKEEALNMANTTLVDNQPPDPASWQPSPGTLYRNKQKTDTLQFINLDAFKIDINNTIIDKPEKHTYIILPVTNSFKLQAADEFDTAEDARNHAITVLLSATDPNNYWVEDDGVVWIISGGRKQASFATGKSKDEATAFTKTMLDKFRQQLYTLKIDSDPYRYKFHYYLGYEDGNRYSFDSTTEYETTAAALDALNNVWSHVASLRLQQDPSGWTLLADDPAIPTSTLTIPATPESLNNNLQFQKTIAQTNPNDFISIKMDEKSQQGQFSWQLVDRDQRVSQCTRDYPDQSTADQDKEKLATLLRQGVKFLEICLDGCITKHRKDPKTGQPGYHFVIKCHNCYYSTGKPMILLESVKGYPSEDEAKTAFMNSYLSLLEDAAKESSYNSLISLTEIISNDPPPGPIVFIPKETKVAFGGADADVIKKMVTITGSYPLKRIEFNSDEFCKRFCVPKDKTIPPTPCGAPKNYVYYCGLIITDPTAPTPTEATPTASNTSFEWQSTNYFKTISDAQLDFGVFIRLLRFPGNLFTDTCDCGDATTYRIYIHEVLAESATRFSTEDAAWGPTGVEKFICALREENSVLAYQLNDCANTFQVNCGQSILKHTTTYPTPSKRDEAKQQLISQFAQWNPKAFTSHRENDFLILTNDQETPFAKTPITDPNKEDILLTIELIDKIYDDNITDIQPEPSLDQEEFKKQLLLFADSYPFIKTTDNRYSIELNFPSPSATTSDFPAPSWTSTCSFNTGAEAQKALEEGTSLLAHSDYYLSTFCSDCRCFTITLADPKDTVAIHPQSYIARESVIDAIQRTRKAANTEGLHLVEHILLRPRNEHPEDCTCLTDTYCSKQSDCSFLWEVDNDDPCQEVKNISFIPGNDPWSFIATIALPAWPDKFSRQDNRLILENALYREAPAHVLLRVLWLTPQDCNRFETQYKAWLKGMTSRTKTGANFSSCEFTQFLFKTNFATMADCQPCHPCPPAPTAVDPCADRLEKSRAKQPPVFSSQVSQLYCWSAKPAPIEPATQTTAPPAPEPEPPQPTP
ncbi:MAG: hypothetical protein JST68_22495 [Bacteroidetes bacterium]|nr:hypothetical protein [Bacteroidota bacterium]